MAIGVESQLWEIFVISEEAHNSRMYKLPSQTKLSKLEEDWAKEVNIPKDTFDILTASGQPVANYQFLHDIGETFTDSKLVKLYVESRSDLRLQLYESTEQTKSMAFRLSQDPETMMDAIRKLFSIPVNRMLRLRFAGSALINNVPLNCQGVGQHSLLQIEFPYRVERREPWGNTIDIFEPLFSADKFEILTNYDSNQEQRLMLGGRCLDPSAEVAEVRTSYGDIQSSTIFLLLFIKKPLTLLIDRVFREVKMWPYDKGNVMVPKHCMLKCGDTICLKHDYLSNVNIPDYGLLYSDPICINLRLTSGKCHPIRVPKLGTVADIREVVRCYEQSDAFVLKQNGLTIKNDDIKVTDLGIEIDSKITVHRVIMDLSVFVNSQIISWTTGKKTLSFTDITNKLASTTGIGYEALNRKTFFCVGCGRSIRKSEEEFQTLPVECCRVKSLRLAEGTVPLVKRKNTGSQTSRGYKAMPVYKSVDAIMPTATMESRLQHGVDSRIPTVQRNEELMKVGQLLVERTQTLTMLQDRSKRQNAEIEKIKNEISLKDETINIERSARSLIEKDLEEALQKLRMNSEMLTKKPNEYSREVSALQSKRKELENINKVLQKQLKECQYRIKKLQQENQEMVGIIKKKKGKNKILKQSLKSAQEVMKKSRGRETRSIVSESDIEKLEDVIGLQTSPNSSCAELRHPMPSQEPELPTQQKCLQVEKKSWPYISRRKKSKTHDSPKTPSAELMEHAGALTSIVVDIPSCTMSPPATSVKRRIYLINENFSDKVENFNLVLSDPVMTRVLMEAVTATLGVDRESLSLWQRIGTGSDGKNYVEVCNAEDEGSSKWWISESEYSDEAGNIFRCDQFTGVETRELCSNYEVLTLAPKRKSIIYIRPSLTSS